MLKSTVIGPELGVLSTHETISLMDPPPEGEEEASRTIVPEKPGAPPVHSYVYKAP
jgi:hypothetical protein